MGHRQMDWTRLAVGGGGEKGGARMREAACFVKGGGRRGQGEVGRKVG